MLSALQWMPTITLKFFSLNRFVVGIEALADSTANHVISYQYLTQYTMSDFLPPSDPKK